MNTPLKKNRELGYPESRPRRALKRGKVYAFRQMSSHMATVPTYELLLCLTDVMESKVDGSLLGVKVIWYHDFWSFARRSTTWLPYNDQYEFFEVESDGTVNLEKLAFTL